MKFHVMTLFPEMIEQGLHTSILGRAMDAGIISLSTVNIRDCSEDKHRHVDDFLCGHYEGVDERVLSRYVTDPVSIGDYVLSGGELPAMVMIDAIARMVPGVLTNEESGETESFENNLLEYPQYTRPEVWRGEAVPEVLLSGHHANVDRWRTERSIDRTLMYRPELLAGAVLDKKAKKYYNEALAAQKRADDEVSKNEK